MTQQVAILGGGIAGLACALELHTQGIEFCLYERSSHLGGMARTLNYKDFKHDTGAHRLHDSLPHITQRWKQLLDDRLENVGKRSAIHRGQQMIEFPLSPVNLLAHSSFSKNLCYIKDWLTRPKGKTENFQQHALTRFGHALAEDFVLSYSRKLWGCDLNELSTELGTGRLKSLNFITLLKELCMPKSQQNQHIDGDFLYPVGGFGALTEAMVQQLPQHSLNTHCEIFSIQNHFDSFNITSPLGRHTYSHVINTLALDQVATLFDRPPTFNSDDFNYRDTHTLFVTLNQESVSDHASLYFPEESCPFTRIHEPRNRWQGMSPQGQTSLLIEVPHWPRERLSPTLIDDCLNELHQRELIDRNKVLNVYSQHIARAYPVITQQSIRARRSLRQHLESQQNFMNCGRNATFRYLHCHDLFKEAEEISFQVKNSLLLGNVNTDTDVLFPGRTLPQAH